MFAPSISHCLWLWPCGAVGNRLRCVTWVAACGLGLFVIRNGFVLKNRRTASWGPLCPMNPMATWGLDRVRSPKEERREAGCRWNVSVLPRRAEIGENGPKWIAHLTFFDVLLKFCIIGCSGAFLHFEHSGSSSTLSWGREAQVCFSKLSKFSSLWAVPGSCSACRTILLVIWGIPGST